MREYPPRHICPKCDSDSIERVPARRTLDRLTRLFGWRLYHPAVNVGRASTISRLSGRRRSGSGLIPAVFPPSRRAPWPASPACSALGPGGPVSSRARYVRLTPDISARCLLRQPPPFPEGFEPCGHLFSIGAWHAFPSILRIRPPWDLHLEPCSGHATDVGARLVLRDVALKALFEHFGPCDEAVGCQPAHRGDPIGARHQPLESGPAFSQRPLGLVVSRSIVEVEHTISSGRRPHFFGVGIAQPVEP